MKPETQHVIVFEIDKNRTEKWKKWCKLLDTVYRSEVVKSLQEEKAEHEMFVSFELHGKTYGIALLEGECLPSNDRREVNRIHHMKVKECLKRVSKANILYSIKTSSQDVSVRALA